MEIEAWRVPAELFDEFGMKGPRTGHQGRTKLPIYTITARRTQDYTEEYPDEEEFWMIEEEPRYGQFLTRRRRPSRFIH